MENAAPEPGLWYVRRHPMERPWGKRVVRLPDHSVLEFVQRFWREAPMDGDRAFEWLNEELGEGWQGLRDMIFVREEGAPMPLAWPQLYALFPDAFEDALHVDEHSLRFLSDDDDHYFADLLFDAEAVRRHPEALAFAIAEDELPTDALGGASPRGDGSRIVDLEPAGSGIGSVTVLMPTSFDLEGHDELLDGTVSSGDSIPGWRVPGIRLGELPEWLRGLPQDDELPQPIRVLRRAAEAGAADVTSLLDRAADLAWIDPSYPPRTPPERRVADHVAWIRQRDETGSILMFDDVWAAAHPQLATSLINWRAHWDPLDAQHRELAKHFTIAVDGNPHDLAGVYRESGSVKHVEPTHACLAGPDLWLLDRQTISRVRLDTFEVTLTAELPFAATGIGFDGASIWVLTAEPDGASQIHRLDDVGRNVETRPLGMLPPEFPPPSGLAFHEGAAFFALGSSYVRVPLDDLDRHRSIWIGPPASIVGVHRTRVAFYSGGDYLSVIHRDGDSHIRSIVELGDASITLAIDDNRLVLLTGGGPEPLAIRCFDIGPDPAHLLEKCIAPADDGAFSHHWRLDGKKIESVDVLRKELADLRRAERPLNPLGQAIPLLLQHQSVNLLAEDEAAAMDDDRMERFFAASERLRKETNPALEEFGIFDTEGLPERWDGR